MKQNKNKTMSGKRYKTKRKIAKHILRRLRRSATATTAVVQPQKVPSESEAVEISDDDLTDVCDHLLKLGFGLKRDKVADCLRQLGDSLNGFDVSKKAEICFQKFLFSDLNNCGSAVLPTIKFQVLKTTLDGPFILQVDEIVNVSSPGFERCLQLLMTDGAQRVYGFEFAPIEALDVCVAPCGLKVKISNVDVIHGRLALFPKNIEVLGGGLVYDLIPSHSGSTLHITDIVQATKGLAGNLWNREPNMGLIRYLLTRLKNEVISHAKTRKSNSDDFITEGCNEASGLVVCFGEMLIDCVPTVGWSIPKGYAFKKAPGGAPANVAVGISKLGGSSAFISKEVCGNRAKMCDLCNKYVRLRERYNHEFNCNGIQDNAGGSSR